MVFRTPEMSGWQRDEGHKGAGGAGAEAEQAHGRAA